MDRSEPINSSTLHEPSSVYRFEKKARATACPFMPCVVLGCAGVIIAALGVILSMYAGIGTIGMGVMAGAGGVLVVLAIVWAAKTN